MEISAQRVTLERLAAPASDAGEILERFLGWAKERGYELYPAQEEAVLEIVEDKHVILCTPTGSGKTLVALAMQFKGVCEGRRSVYTSPIKALVSEKFFDLCQEMGAANVGMLTGDASINPKAPIICCTAEILANMALREGRYTPFHYVIMDEFHYYADRDRGSAWQIPLIELRDATFLLMSATLGDMSKIAERLEARTGKAVAYVRTKERPVPLDYEFRETALHRTVDELVAAGKAPIYLVSFTQREAAEQAQNLTSINVTSKEEKQTIVEAISGFRFDSTYGKDIRRFVRNGIGLHHAGLLPKYRLLMEQLSQRGLLKVISGTDTLGVGVNIPIRTVLFTRLYKFDGAKTSLLSVRDFQQIGGRAGRKGFDEKGSVVCQAPEHVVDNKQLDAKVAKDPSKKSKAQKKKPPTRGYIHYDAGTFKRLIESDAEPLRSQLQISHSTLMNVLVRDPEHGRRDGGYRRLVRLIANSDESERSQSHLRKRAAVLLRSLLDAGIAELVHVEWDSRPYLTVKAGLQRDFSLNQSLSLFLVEVLSSLDPQSESYPMDVLTLVESTLEDPQVILFRQIDKLKTQKMAEMKAQGVEYDERIAELEKITYPKPNADAIYATFDDFRRTRPWVGHENIRPKSIARDMIERYCSFNDYVVEYGLQSSEGVLLRYLSGAYKALVQSVPDDYKTDAVLESVAYLRAVLAHVDSSLVSEWESMLVPSEEGEPAEVPTRVRPNISADPRAFAARVRAELHQLVKALAGKDYEQAVSCVRTATREQDPGGVSAWSTERFEEALAPFFAEHGTLVFNHRARLSELTHMRQSGPLQWQVQQTLVDPEEQNLWAIEAEIDLTESDAADGPLLRLRSIGS